MRMFVFEGSPEEIGQVLKTLGPLDVTQITAPQVETKGRPPLPLTPPIGVDEAQDMKFVTVEFARAAMTRISLSEPLKKVLVALRDADPDWVSAAELYKASGYEGQQFAGLMGAFGRRMKHTDGYDEDAYFFDFEWDEDASAWKYRLPDSVIEAMRLEKIS